MLTRFCCSLLLVLGASVALATAQQNNTDNIRPVPPPGIEVPAAERAELEADIAALGKEIEALRAELKGKPALLELLPDVQIYHNAARYALGYNEFYKPEEIKLAKQVIENFEGDLDLQEYRDEYQEELRRIIDAKIAGEEVVATAEDTPPNVVNLMDALRQSLDRVSTGKKKTAKVVEAKPVKAASAKAQAKKRAAR